MSFFDATTNAQKITFKDNLETIPHELSIDVDADGNLPSIFYSGSARAVFLDENGQQYESTSPIGEEVGLGNFTDYSDIVVYDKGDFTKANNERYYKSLANSNQGNDPTLNPGTNEFWEEVVFLGIYNTKIPYAIGNIVSTADGNLWQSLTDSNLNNDPSTDVGTNWIPAVDGSKIPEVALNTDAISKVIPHLVGATLTAGGQINQLRVTSAFFLPLANSVDVNTILVVELDDTFGASTPSVTRTGADLIRNGSGTDTNLAFKTAARLTLTSDGTSEWRL